MKAQTKHSNRGTDGNLALVPGRGGWRRLCLVPGDRLALQECDRVADGDGGARSGDGSGGGFGKGYSAGAQPAAFDETYDRARVDGEDGGAALAKIHRMAEEENFGGWGGFFKLGGFVGKDFAGKAVFPGDFEGVGALLPRRVERERGRIGRVKRAQRREVES